MALARKDQHTQALTGSAAARGFDVPAQMLEACRAASLRIGGPRLKSLGVTSTIRGEGKSTIALALALIQAFDYHRGVILVELDLENPALADRFGLNRRPGVTELAMGQATVSEAVQGLADGIGVITAGGPAWSPSKAAIEVSSSGILQAIRNETEILVTDLPSVTSGLGAQWVEALERVVYVVRAGVTPMPRVREAIATLSAEPALLLNGTDSSLPRWLRLIIGL